MSFRRVAFPRGITYSEQQTTSIQKEFEFEDVADGLISNLKGPQTAHFNTSGLLSKPDFLRIRLRGTKFDIFCMSESKLDANTHNNEIKIDSYDLYCLDHNRHSGSIHLSRIIRKVTI